MENSINDNEILSICNNKGDMDGIKVLREKHNFSLTMAAKYVKGLKDKQTSGTISWFEIAKGELPARTPGDDYTNNMTLYNKNLDQFCRGAYIHSINEWRHGTGNWQPTHWAYINYP